MIALITSGGASKAGSPSGGSSARLSSKRSVARAKSPCRKQSIACCPSAALPFSAVRLRAQRGDHRLDLLDALTIEHAHAAQPAEAA
jgi:hypothetical protein